MWEYEYDDCKITSITILIRHWELLFIGYSTATCCHPKAGRCEEVIQLTLIGMTAVLKEAWRIS